MSGVGLPAAIQPINSNVGTPGATPKHNTCIIFAKNGINNVGNCVNTKNGFLGVPVIGILADDIRYLSQRGFDSQMQSVNDWAEGLFGNSVQKANTRSGWSLLHESAFNAGTQSEGSRANFNVQQQNPENRWFNGGSVNINNVAETGDYMVPENGRRSQERREDSREDSRKKRESPQLARWQKETEARLADDIERWEDWREKEEERQERVDRLKLYTLLTVPFFFFEKPRAANFAASKLFKMYMGDLGISDEYKAIIWLFLSCVDMNAFQQGRLRFVDGYQIPWYKEVYDYSLVKIDAPDLIRLGSLMFLLPMVPRPEYEERQ